MVSAAAGRLGVPGGLLCWGELEGPYADTEGLNASGLRLAGRAVHAEGKRCGPAKNDYGNTALLVHICMLILAWLEAYACLRCDAWSRSSESRVDV